MNVLSGKQRNGGRAACRRAFLAALGASVAFGSCAVGAPFYLAKQGLGQARILLSRQPVEKVLQGAVLTEAQKGKLRHMERVRQFAREKLGLKDTDSFRTFVPIEGEAVSYVVSAAPEFELNPHTWWFPIVGSVPYLGFFSREDALRFEGHMRSEGYDTHLGEVAAYSTLGWFSDPVFSPQLGYSDAYLTGLVIHEMVHSTIWIKGRADFNEALASFVEEKGRLHFYRMTEGPNGPTEKRILAYHEEERKLNGVLDETEKELRLLYASSRPDGEKRTEKARLLADLAGRLEVGGMGHRAPTVNNEWNNARFAVRSVYRPEWPIFERTFQECGGDLHCFVSRYQVYARNMALHPDQFRQ